MVRSKKLSASLEDYLEAIYLISREHGEARSMEIMEHLGVSGPSVTEALRLLQARGLVNYTPYEAITLTDEGDTVARDVLHRHETLRDFFIEVLGVDRETADVGACRMEHVVSRQVIGRILSYTSFLREECARRGCDKMHCFKDYLREAELRKKGHGSS